MNAAELIDLVQANIQDTSFSREEDILPVLNRGIQAVASRVVLPETVVMASLAVPSGTVSLTLPDDFFRRLLFCHDISDNSDQGRQVAVVTQFGNFMARFPGLNYSGEVTHVCPVGTTLYVQGKPESPVTLRIFYTREPVLLSGDNTSEPEDVPVEFRQRLLYHYACSEIHALIEDGMEGSKKQNTNYHQGQYLQALAELAGAVDNGWTQPDLVPDDDMYAKEHMRLLSWPGI